MKMRHKRKSDIRKRLGIGFVFTGFVLVISVAVIFAVNGLENRMAGRKAELLLYDIQAAVENDRKNTPQPEKPAWYTSIISMHMNL